MNRLKKLISEEVKKVRLEILEENILSDLLALFLTPKVKKAVKILRDDPEFVKLEKKIKDTQVEINAITKRLEKNLTEREKHLADMKSLGIKVDSKMNSEQVFRAYKDWQSKMNKELKIGKTGIQDWEKYFS